MAAGGKEERFCSGASWWTLVVNSGSSLRPADQHLLPPGLFNQADKKAFIFGEGIDCGRARCHGVWLFWLWDGGVLRKNRPVLIYVAQPRTFFTLRLIKSG